MFRNYTSRLIRFWRKGIVGIERNVLIKYDTHDKDFCLRIYIRTKELKSGSSLEREREIEFIGSSRSDNSPIIYLLHFSRQPFLYIYIYWVQGFLVTRHSNDPAIIRSISVRSNTHNHYVVRFWTSWERVSYLANVGSQQETRILICNAKMKVESRTTIRQCLVPPLLNPVLSGYTFITERIRVTELLRQRGTVNLHHTRDRLDFIVGVMVSEVGREDYRNAVNRSN